MTTETNTETLMTEEASKDTAPEATKETSNESTTWKDSLPEDLRKDKSLESIKSVEDLSKSYISAQRMLGNRVPIPSKDASKEVQDEFYKKVTAMPNIVKLPEENDPKANEELSKIYDKLGRPASPDKYKLDIPEDIKDHVDTDYLKEIKDVAYKSGLSQSQLKALADVHLKQEGQIKQILSDQKEATRQFLKQEWGNAFEENKESYRSVLAKYEQKYPEAVQELKNGYAGNNVVMLMMAAELGKIYKENGTISPKSGKGGSMTPEMAKERIAEIMGNKQHAYHDRNNPAHNEAVLRVNALFKDVYPEQE